MEFLAENKILARDGVVELVDNKYMCFRVHEHIRKPDKSRTDEIINAYAKLSGNKKSPLMIVASQIDRVDEEEKQIIRETAKRFFTAQAIVTKSNFTIMVVNLLMLISTPPVPTKIFSDEQAALQWMEKYMQ